MIPTFDCLVNHALILPSKFHDSAKERGYQYYLICCVDGRHMVGTHLHHPLILNGPEGWEVVDIFCEGVYVNGVEVDQRNRKLVRRKAWDGELFWSWDSPDHYKEFKEFDVVKINNVEFCL